MTSRCLLWVQIRLWACSPVSSQTWWSWSASDLWPYLRINDFWISVSRMGIVLYNEAVTWLWMKINLESNKQNHEITAEFGGKRKERIKWPPNPAHPRVVDLLFYCHRMWIKRTTINRWYTDHVLGWPATAVQLCSYMHQNVWDHLQY